MTDDRSSLNRPNWRRRVIVALFAGAVVVGSAWFYAHVTERSRMVTAIEAAGGAAYAPNCVPFAERIVGTLLGDGDPQRMYSVRLRGPKFDDAWLERHDDLRVLRIESLMVVDSAISREAALRLLERHRLKTLTVPGMPLTDADAAWIGREETLGNLNVMQSEITDAGLAAIRPERLHTLNVAGTAVTAAALQQHTADAKVMFLSLDGQQFTPELAAQLSQATRLKVVRLYGPDVTDAHVRQLESMPRLMGIDLDQTSVTEAAISALKAANPTSRVDVIDERSSFYRRRPFNSSSGAGRDEQPLKHTQER